MWRVILLTLTGVCMLTVLGAMIYIDREGRSNVPEEADAPEFVVVLGAQVQGDQPSLTLKKRLDLALSYLNDHPQAKVIVSGAQGADEAYTDRSIRHGEVSDRAGRGRKPRHSGAEQAHDTRENLEFSRELAEQYGMDTTSVLIITSDFHLCRAKYLARKLGMEPYGLASQTWPEILRVNYLLRRGVRLYKPAAM